MIFVMTNCLDVSAENYMPLEVQKEKCFLLEKKKIAGKIYSPACRQAGKNFFKSYVFTVRL